VAQALQDTRYGPYITGQGRAIAGIVLGILQVVLALFWFVGAGVLD